MSACAQKNVKVVGLEVVKTAMSRWVPKNIWGRAFLQKFELFVEEPLDKAFPVNFPHISYFPHTFQLLLVTFQLIFRLFHISNFFL